MVKSRITKKTVILGITSGIAAYKMPDFIRLLKKEAIDVEVVMTASASKMVDPNEIEKASCKKVYIDLFVSDFDYRNILRERRVDHIDLADRADVIVIAPATANVIAKLAHGIADDFLTTMVLASSSPIILSPSMNVHMWHNPATQENIELLKKRGFVIIPPEKGPLACGYEGLGRLPHLEKIKEEVLLQSTKSKSLSRKRILVTAGGTTEHIDDARVLTNRSSGKMAIAIAETCFLRGAEVTLLRARTSVTPRYHMKEELFTSADELLGLMRKYLHKTDLVFHAAAVSDFTAEKAKGKISSDKAQLLRLIPQKKIINFIKKEYPSVQLIGFKAVSKATEKEMLKAGKDKIAESNADAIVVNDIGKNDRGFEVDENEVVVVFRRGEIVTIPLQSKMGIANILLEKLLERKIL